MLASMAETIGQLTVRTPLMIAKQFGLVGRSRFQNVQENGTLFLDLIEVAHYFPIGIRGTSSLKGDRVWRIS